MVKDPFLAAAALGTKAVFVRRWTNHMSVFVVEVGPIRRNEVAFPARIAANWNASARRRSFWTRFFQVTVFPLLPSASREISMKRSSWARVSDRKKSKIG